MFRFLFGLVLVSAACANPQGGTVEFGSATISSAGKVMTINQSTDKAILHWQRFENTPTETIRFNQPAITSATLNRVVGIDPSVISGALQSNGRLFLINPNGIVFGPTSKVNVGSLVASTLDITDADFKNDNLLFLQTPGIELSSVINRGEITAQPGQTVALLAPIVDNSGKIVAAAGRVILRADLVAFFDGVLVPPEAGLLNASGKPVRMAEVGLTPLLQDVVNTQSVATANQVVNLGDGTVFLRGAGGIAVNGGEVNVNGTPANPAGGRVDVIAHRAIGLGPNSRITAVGNGASENTGQVNLSTQTAAILTSRAGGTAPSHALVQAGRSVNVGTFSSIQSDTGGGLEVKAPKVSLFAHRAGDPGKPVKIAGGSAINANIEGDMNLLFAGDVTVDLLFASGFSVNVQSTGNVFAGEGSRTIPVTVRPVVVVPEPGGPPPPPPVEVVHVFASSITIDAAGDIGTEIEPLSVNDGPPFFAPVTLTSGTGRIFKVTPLVESVVLPGGGAGSGLVDDLPVPRPRFVPPTDPIEAVSAPVVAPVAAPGASAPLPVSGPADPGPAAPSSDNPVIGGRDNVLLPALRGTYAKSDSAPSGDSGGLIEVVRSTDGRTADPIDSDEDSEPNRVANRKK